MAKHLYRKGHAKMGGRVKGTPNRMSAEILAARQAFQAALSGEMNFTPLQVMYAVMMLRISRGDDAGALEAAKEAAPFVHARLNAAEVMVHHTLHNRSDEQIASDIEALRLKIASAQTIEVGPAAVADGSAKHPAAASIVEAVEAEPAF
jgi:hypothetical protein